MPDLRTTIEQLFALPAGELPRAEARSVFAELKTALNSGNARAAEPGTDGAWHVNHWVKQGILLGFRAGELTDMSSNGLAFFDKDNLTTRTMSVSDNVRIVPGGSSIRDGVYIAPGVICMPPMYINIGAYVDEGTLVDSHALVGTCAQIGKHVHVSAAAQIGGVLEPVGANPVIIEDDVLVGGNCGVYEGVIVRNRAVLASGVILTASVRIYDIVNDRVIAGTSEAPLEVPSGAVVVSGSRAVDGSFAEKHGLHISTPIIVKYRDTKTDARTALESALR